MSLKKRLLIGLSFTVGSTAAAMGFKFFEQNNFRGCIICGIIYLIGVAGFFQD